MPVRSLFVRAFQTNCLVAPQLNPCTSPSPPSKDEWRIQMPGPPCCFDSTAFLCLVSLTPGMDWNRRWQRAHTTIPGRRKEEMMGRMTRLHGIAPRLTQVLSFFSIFFSFPHLPRWAALRPFDLISSAGGGGKRGGKRSSALTAWAPLPLA